MENLCRQKACDMAKHSYLFLSTLFSTDFDPVLYTLSETFY